MKNNIQIDNLTNHQQPVDMVKNFAVIDVGTLKSKFEIRQIDISGKSILIYKDKKLTVLGRDLDKNNDKISEKSVMSVIEALNEFKKKMHEHGVVGCRAVTTEAIRRATNSKEILSRIKKETGIYLETLSHKDEANTLFISISKDFPGKIIAVADIGGGSVQVVIGKDSEILETHLFKTGTYFLQEKFTKTHLPSDKELNEAIKYIYQEMSTLKNAQAKPEFLVYGTTNIIDFLQAMKIELSTINVVSDHSYAVKVKELLPLYEKIISLSYEERMPMYPAEPYYMWAADKALMNIFQICDYLEIETVVPSNNNISTAMLNNLAAEHYQKIDTRK